MIWYRQTPHTDSESWAGVVMLPLPDDTASQTNNDTGTPRSAVAGGSRRCGGAKANKARVPGHNVPIRSNSWPFQLPRRVDMLATACLVLRDFEISAVGAMTAFGGLEAQLAAVVDLRRIKGRVSDRYITALARGPCVFVWCILVTRSLLFSDS